MSEQPARFEDCDTISDLKALIAARRNDHLTDTDIKSDNDLRALWGGVAVVAFADRVFGASDEEDWDTIIGDLFADLMHLCDALGQDFDALVARGRWHYEPELVGEL